jgi:hypothetical protein
MGSSMTLRSAGPAQIMRAAVAGNSDPFIGLVLVGLMVLLAVTIILAAA